MSKYDPQAAPVPCIGKDDRAGSIKIDRVTRLAGRTLVAGWCTTDVELALSSSGGDVSGQVFHTGRPDVTAHFDLPAASTPGFVLVGSLAEGAVELVCGSGDARVGYPLVVDEAVELDHETAVLLAPAVASLAAGIEPFSLEWTRLIALIPVADDAAPPPLAGVIDEAVASASVRQGRASGWVLVPEGSVIWIQDSNGGFHDLAQAAWVDRKDVTGNLAATQGFAVRSHPGFHLHLDQVAPGDQLHLRMLDGGVVRELGQTRATPLPADPAGASRRLFPAHITMSRLAERLPLAEGPVIDALIAADRSGWDARPVQVKQLGARLERPVASMIVPLYGRADFVEHQMLEFAKDDWLQRNVELVYVVDDPALADGFLAESHQLHRLYRVPFRVLWGGTNRGFAGANNLGAAHASAQYLLFVNSDVFPRQPGWIQPLLSVLEKRADVGVVAPLLLFADGSVQHAGMEFHRREEFGIWTNHHPYMGLDPSLVPHAGFTEAPAVTGACMALRRDDFEAVGGWDTGYLIGDFEDSDLCLKLRQRGLKSGYLPEVGLTHLERQSFRLLGAGDYRNQVVVYNALRHQQRWAGLLDVLGQEN